MKAMSKLMWSAIEPTTRATLAKQLAFQRTLRMYPANYLGPHTALLEEISTAVGTAAVTGAWGTLTATPEALAAPPPAPPPSPAEQRAAKRAARKAAAPAPAAGPVKAKVPAAGAAKWGRVGTASELYKRLIMDEGLDNATCFARVTAELGDKAAGKPSYPGWYRCQLRKDGFDPPVSPPVTPKSNA
jgi:hypothetical protein